MNRRHARSIWGLVGNVTLACVSLLTPRGADAGYLHMVPSTQVRLDEDAKTVIVNWTVKNDGDEPAHEVALDLPALNESYSFSSAMPAGERADVELKIPFDRLGIHRRGGYSLLYRILYKDANFYSFSAPYSMSIVLPPAPTRVLSGGPDGFSEISLSSRARGSVTLQNVSSIEADVDKIEPVAPVEVAVALDSVQLPLKLAPGERRSLDFHVTRAGALLGSTYVMGLVASGVAGDRHFAERISFTIRVVAPLLTGRTFMGVALAVLAVGTTIFWMRKRRSPIRR